MIRENCTVTRPSSGTQAQDSVKKSCTQASNFWPASRVPHKVNCNWPKHPSSPSFKSSLGIAIMIDLRVSAWKYAHFMSIMTRQYGSDLCDLLHTWNTRTSTSLLYRSLCDTVGLRFTFWTRSHKSHCRIVLFSPYADVVEHIQDDVSLVALENDLSVNTHFPQVTQQLTTNQSTSLEWHHVSNHHLCSLFTTNHPWYALSTKMIVGPPPSSFTSCRKFGQLIALPATHWGHQLVKGQCVSLWTRTCSVEGPFGRVLVWPSLTSVTSSSSSSWPYNPFSQLTAVLKLVVVLLLLRFTQYWWT